MECKPWDNQSLSNFLDNLDLQKTAVSASVADFFANKFLFWWALQ